MVTFLLAACCSPLASATIDRIAALVDRQVLTVSEISQMEQIRFFSRAAKQSDDDYRREILDDLVAQALRYRDVERFGATDVSKSLISLFSPNLEPAMSPPTSPSPFTAGVPISPVSLIAAP